MKEKRESLIIGSRESLLAVRQARIVLDYLRGSCPDLRCELRTMKTTGDRILDKRLDQIGGKGLFVRELDQALRDGRTDLSVHSLKDVPAEIPEGLPLIGFSEREDPRDVLVLPAGAAEIDFSKPIGTSSRRRILQARDLFPQARFESVRGNVQTRLRKLDEGQYGAIILAAAGLRRLGLEGRISRYFSTEEIIPSAGQGILALQGRKGEDYACLNGFLSRTSAMAAAAERGFVNALGGGCTSPIAAHAEFTENLAEESAEESTGESVKEFAEEFAEEFPDGKKRKMTLRGFYYDDHADRGIRKSVTVFVASSEEADAAGRELAAAILAECG